MVKRGIDGSADTAIRPLRSPGCNSDTSSPSEFKVRCRIDEAHPAYLRSSARAAWVELRRTTSGTPARDDTTPHIRAAPLPLAMQVDRAVLSARSFWFVVEGAAVAGLPRGPPAGRRAVDVDTRR